MVKIFSWQMKIDAFPPSAKIRELHNFLMAEKMAWNFYWQLRNRRKFYW